MRQTRGRGHCRPMSLRELVIKLERSIRKMAGELDALTAEVARNTDVDKSAVVLLKGLKAKLDEAIANNNMPAVQALSDSLGASTSELAAAVTENTPAE